MWPGWVATHLRWSSFGHHPSAYENCSWLEPVKRLSISETGSTVTSQKKGNKDPGLERFHKHVYDFMKKVTEVNHGITQTVGDSNMGCPVVQMYRHDL